MDLYYMVENIKIPTGFNKCNYNYKKLDYPYNLVLDIKDDKELFKNIPNDINESLNYILSTLLDKEKRYLLFRYKDKMTYSSIAKIEECSVDWVRHVVCRGLRNLRHPNKYAFIKYGICNYINNIKKEYYEAGFYNGLKINVNNYCNRVGIKDPKEIIHCYTPLNCSIYELELSSRSTNALLRSGIKTLKDLISLTESELYKIRFLGRNSLEEIINKLKSLNLTLKIEGVDAYNEIDGN